MTLYERIIPIRYSGLPLSKQENLDEFLSETGKELDGDGNLTLGSVTFDPSDLVWLREMFPGSSEADQHFTENWDIRPVWELEDDFAEVATKKDDAPDTEGWHGGLRVEHEHGRKGTLYNRSPRDDNGGEYWFIKWDGDSLISFAHSYPTSSLRLI